MVTSNRNCNRNRGIQALEGKIKRVGVPVALHPVYQPPMGEGNFTIVPGSMEVSPTRPATATPSPPTRRWCTGPPPIRGAGRKRPPWSSP